MTQRQYCNRKHKDGRECYMFLNHISELHYETNRRSSWTDEECEPLPENQIEISYQH